MSRPPASFTRPEILDSDRELATALHEGEDIPILNILATMYNVGGESPRSTLLQHPVVPPFLSGVALETAVAHNLLDEIIVGDELNLHLTAQGFRVAIVLGELELREMFQSEIGTAVFQTMNHILMNEAEPPEDVAEATGLSSMSVRDACIRLGGCYLSHTDHDTNLLSVTPFGWALMQMG